ncbi:MAG: FAD:protein FMN transferase [Clostridium sp.]|nr:FAD:protein FMN transferase [Clostridium sp.]
MKYVDMWNNSFGTRIYQKVSANIDELHAEKVLDKAVTLMKDFEKELSFYNKESDISKINRNAGIEFVKVSKDTYNIVKSAVHFGKITDGLFDITIAPIVKAWNISSENPQVLSSEKAGELLPLVNYEDILFDDNNMSIKLLNKNSMIDLGGIAKGYIADKVIELYKENNIESGIINLGGNIKVLRRKENDNLWEVGIYEPKKHSSNIVCTIKAEDKSIVTSGAYERGFMCNDKYYHHILNPKTGYPAESDLKSITIISDLSIDGDGLSTPLFIMGKYKAYEFMKNKNISGIMITDKDEIIITRDLIDKFTLTKEYKVMC